MHVTPVFGLTKRGNQVLNLGAYRYNRATSCRGRKVRWYCTRLYSPDFLKMFSFTFLSAIGVQDIRRKYIQKPVFSTTSSGNPVINLGAYRYNKSHGYKGPKLRWTCTRYALGCRSTIITYNNTIIHHKVPVFSTTPSGNPVINLGAYRYNKCSGYKGPKLRWTCTRYPLGCRSTIITYNNVIIDHKAEHNH
ncbi:hypothetical protein B5X24_HaOG203946 [Helicoverpa armigera]|uniref:FLYWCH-type domain-containing protein n=1 Tax=Helicoverpa armigera TaxID=29058 RepID=A0A2W1BTM5_HELAM|nr:hypothetical protein B5X24_HaOG203946 [Helicoverpa armigera]